MDFKTKYFAIWQEVWGLHKKYWQIPMDYSEMWKQFAAEAEALRSRYVSAGRTFRGETDSCRDK